MAFNLLNALRARTGRLLRENGLIFNEADAGFLSALNNPTAVVFNGKGFFWSDITPALNSGDTYFYSFVLSATKHTVIYTRNFAAEQGPMSLHNLVGATFTPGTDKPAINLFAGQPAADIQVTRGATSVSGGVEILVDELFGAGNNTAVAGSAGLPTIFPPGAQLVLRITSNATGSNRAKLSLGFAELEIPAEVYS